MAKQYSWLCEIIDKHTGEWKAGHNHLICEQLTTYITKEKAKAELAAQFKYEPAIAHAIGYCRGLGHPDSYLEKQFSELAQLAKDKEGQNG